MHHSNGNVHLALSLLLSLHRTKTKFFPLHLGGCGGIGTKQIEAYSTTYSSNLSAAAPTRVCYKRGDQTEGVTMKSKLKKQVWTTEGQCEFGKIGQEFPWLFISCLLDTIAAWVWQASHPSFDTWSTMCHILQVGGSGWGDGRSGYVSLVVKYMVAHWVEPRS